MNISNMDKEYIVKEINRYYGSNEEKLKSIFILNDNKFGDNFYGKIQGHDFQTKTIFLTQELILKDLIDDFIQICRQDYPNFAKKTDLNLALSPEKNGILSRVKPVEQPKLTGADFIFMDKSLENFDNSFVYLAIKLTEKILVGESFELGQNNSKNFSIESWVAIPKSPKNNEGEKNLGSSETSKQYQFIYLLKTFKKDRDYTKTEIEENFSNLIIECNEEMAKSKSKQNLEIAIEWILPEALFSESVEFWNYKNTKIGCWGRFHSVHIRSSQRLSRKYTDCISLWQKKWDFLWSNFQKINLSNYILACQYHEIIDDYLEPLFEKDNHDHLIIGINIPIDLRTSNQFDYEQFIIETGIPIALWPRCKTENDNYIRDLDKLINPDNNKILNLSNLPKDVRQMRQQGKKAQKESSEHLGSKLCFLWENPYNFPQDDRHMEMEKK